MEVSDDSACTVTDDSSDELFEPNDHKTTVPRTNTQPAPGPSSCDSSTQNTSRDMDTLINIILVNMIVLSLVDGVFRAYDSNYTFLFEVLLLVHYCVQITCCRESRIKWFVLTLVFFVLKFAVLHSDAGKFKTVHAYLQHNQIIQIIETKNIALCLVCYLSTLISS